VLAAVHRKRGKRSVDNSSSDDDDNDNSDDAYVPQGDEDDGSDADPRPAKQRTPREPAITKLAADGPTTPAPSSRLQAVCALPRRR